jgi:hypothetical protein
MAPSAVETTTIEQPTPKAVVSLNDYKQIGNRRFSKEAETQGTGDFAPATVCTISSITLP